MQRRRDHDPEDAPLADVERGEQDADIEPHAAQDAATEVESHPKFAELQDRYLRLAAEYDNYRKRTAREWREHQARAGAEVLREILELADNLERALQAPVEDGTGLRKGVELIAQQLQAKLRRFGVEPIDTNGQEFDPNRHEAVLAVDTDAVPSQRVVDEVQRGYTLNGEVLRPARVTVAR
jgi:molecular chaperone GrpE